MSNPLITTKKIVLGVIVVVAVLGLILALSWHRTAVAPDSSPAQGSVSPVASHGQPVVVVSSSGNMRVSEPQFNAVVGHPLTIRGSARVFENQFNYRLKDQDGTVLVDGHAYANAPDTGQFGDFEITVDYPTPHGTHGTVEVFDFSAKDGTEIDKVTIPVIFGGRQSGVKIYFTSSQLDPQTLRCETTYPVPRSITNTTAPARAALEALFAGPTADELAHGYTTALNTGIKIQSLVIANGTAKVDLNSALQQGVAGSCRVMAIRSQIENTLKQFASVKNVVISVNGNSTTILQP